MNYSNKTKFTVLSVVLSIFLWSAATATSIQVKNPGNNNDIQPNLQAAVNSAVAGDEVVLPAGTFVINKSVVITKFISIKGQGLTQTILYRAESVEDATLSNDSQWDGILRFAIYSNASSKIVVSGICFKSKKPSMVSGDGLSLAEDIGVRFIKCLDFIVTGCRFENFGNGAISVLHDDSIVGGLIYKNEFVHNVKGEDGLGLGYGIVIYGTNTKWLVNPRLGTSNFIFVEDNYFEYHRHSIAAGGCALYVFRHNKVMNNVAANTSHAVDSHEARLIAGENYYSTRAIEVYDDSLINTKFLDGTGNIANGTLIAPGESVTLLTECAIKTRGGEAMIYNNFIQGYRFATGLKANSVLSTTYPIPYQQGYLSAEKYGINQPGKSPDEEDGDVFLWNNTFIRYIISTPATPFLYNYSPSYLIADRDYHFYAKASYKPYTYPHPFRGTVMTVNTSATNVSCYGSSNGTASVSVTGGVAPYKYNWNNGKNTSTVTGLAAGTYSVTITDGSSSSTTRVLNITQPQKIALAITVISTVGSISATVVPNGGVAPYSYLWSTKPAQVTALASGLIIGSSYSVTVTDKNTCSSTSAVTISTTGISENNGREIGDISVYPNPTEGLFSIKFFAPLKEDYTLEIHDTLGKLLKAEKLNSVQGDYLQSYDLTNYGKGIYIISLSNSSAVSIERIVVY